MLAGAFVPLLQAVAVIKWGDMTNALTGSDGPGRTTRRGGGALRAGLLASSALVAATLPATAQTIEIESATWNLNGTGDFNTAANWTPAAVPYVSAFFGTSNQNNVWFSDSTVYVGDLIFNAGASDYTFTNTRMMYFVGAEIVVNGGSATINNSGTLYFMSGQVGDATINNTGNLLFDDYSSAGRATINNNGNVIFQSDHHVRGGGSAGSAKIENNKNLYFYDKSTAGSATITNHDYVLFTHYSTAGSATIVNDSLVLFMDASSAGNATITNNSGGRLSFEYGGSAGNATIINNSGGMLRFVGYGTGGTARLINNGTVDLTYLSGAISGTTAGSIEGGGIIHLAGKNLAVGGNNLSTTFSGILDGPGGSLTKEGAGTLTLAGVNTYGGGTTVNSGTLLVNGSIASAATVNNGGTLGGSGTIFNNVAVNSGGTFAPGTPGLPGSLMTVGGDVTFGPDAIYRVQADPTTASLTQVNGIAHLNGSVQMAFTAGSYALGQQYTILQSSNPVAGVFQGISSNGFLMSLNYDDPHKVMVTLEAAALAASAGLKQNHQNAAGAIDNVFNNGGLLSGGFATLFSLTGDALRGALNQVSGESGASISQSTFVAWNQVFNMMFDPFAGGRSGMNGQGAMPFAAEANAQPEGARLAYAAVTPKGEPGLVTKAPLTPLVYEPRWSIWGGGYGSTAKTDGDTVVGSHDTTARAFGFVVGADHRLTPDTLIGFALAGGGTSFGLAQGLGGGRSDLFQASVYARQNWGAAYVMGAFGYGWQDFTLNRTVTIAGNDKLQADFDANALAGRAEGGWRFGSAWTGMTPYAAVQVASLRLPGYSEHATSGADTFALAYAGRTDTQTRSELGARFDHAMPLQDALLTLRGRAAWAHAYDDNNVANAAFMTLPGAAFVVNGAMPDADALLISGGAEIAFRNGFAIAGSFEGEFSGNTESYAGKGAIRYRW